MFAYLLVLRFIDKFMYKSNFDKFREHNSSIQPGGAASLGLAAPRGSMGPPGGPIKLSYREALQAS